jgi:hypothetical protein
LPPAPWHLSGSGAILLYRFPKAWALERGLIPRELRSAFVGGLGAVMLVDYSASPVGPYREALFIPGLFRLDCGIVGSVTRIVVSSEPSVVGGWVNWGLPKEGAAFERVGGRFAVWQDGVAMLKAELRGLGPQLPVSTSWSPLPLRIAQWRAGRRYVTQLVGKGAVQFAHLRSIAVNADLFPDVSPFRPLLALRVTGFALTFPVPEVTIADSR